MTKAIAVDLSTELAEGFALPPGGVPLPLLRTLRRPPDGSLFHSRHAAQRFDNDLFPIISSAHLACGLHSGDPVIMQRCIAQLVQFDIQLGAHPSYPDVFDFGQRRVELAHEELVAVLLYQFGALQGVLTQFDRRIEHVKCHGALAFDVAYEAWACAAMVEAIRRFDPTLILVAMTGSQSVEQARAAGLRVIEEGFADRGYDRNGRIVPRDHPKALLTAIGEVKAQVSAMAKGLPMPTVDGGVVTLPASTFCLHSDTPSAGVFATQLRTALEADGVQIRPIAALLR